MRIPALPLALAAILPECGLCAEAARPPDVPPVVIDYFYEAGCPDCDRVRDQVMPELRARYEGFYALNRFDVGIKTNVLRLIAYQENLDIRESRPVCIVVDYRHVFNGFDAIKTGFLGRVEERVAARMEPGWNPPEPIRTAPENAGLAEERIRRFTLSAVVMAGLLDGINPCAISTLVFFMSLLAVTRIRGGGLLLVGVAFCAASFATYTAIGFGLLRVLYLFDGLPGLRMGLETVMMALLGVLAYLSFRDAYRFRKTGDPHQVAIQLPNSMKARMHKVMRSGLGLGSLALGGLTIGTAVTALESVCTGQVYVPTLVLVAKSGKSASTAWPYLMLYNLMFIVPLTAVFLLAYVGINARTLLEWSKSNVVLSKVLLGLLFLGMAVLIAVL